MISCASHVQEVLWLTADGLVIVGPTAHVLHPIASTSGFLSWAGCKRCFSAPYVTDSVISHVLRKYDLSYMVAHMCGTSEFIAQAHHKMTQQTTGAIVSIMTKTFWRERSSAMYFNVILISIPSMWCKASTFCTSKASILFSSVGFRKCSWQW